MHCHTCGPRHYLRVPAVEPAPAGQAEHALLAPEQGGAGDGRARHRLLPRPQYYLPLPMVRQGEREQLAIKGFAPSLLII